MQHSFEFRATAFNAALYACSAALIAAGIYYVPNYSFLQRLTAEHSAIVLRMIGLEGSFRMIGADPYVNEFLISLECTGIQVVAVFSGIILPMPRISALRKIIAVSIVALSVYFANLVRIGIEVWMLYNGVLPWDQAHGDLGVLLGIVSVMFLVVLADRFIPEIGDFMMGLEQKIRKKIVKREA